MYVFLEATPNKLLSRFYIETAMGDRCDISSNTVRHGYYVRANATLRLSDRFSVELRIKASALGNTVLAKGKDVAQREYAMQIVSVHPLTARDNLSLIAQTNSTRRQASFYPSGGGKDKSEVLSIVYGHLRSLGTTLYVGATTSKSVKANNVGAISTRHQNEEFAKLSWLFDVAAVL